MSRLKEAISQRTGWETDLKPFLYKELPSNPGWSATLGSLCALLFAVMAVSGMFLAMYYNPSPDKAYQSIDYITNEVPLGSVLRGIHHWGAGAMVLAVLAHLATVFFYGSFKAPRELTWIVGVCLLLATLGLGFTGYLLPWDQKAYWATVVSANIPREIPVVGDLLTRLLLGGEGVSGLTLTRFYSIHMLVLPALMADPHQQATFIWSDCTVCVNIRQSKPLLKKRPGPMRIGCTGFSRNISPAAPWCFCWYSSSSFCSPFLHLSPGTRWRARWMKATCPALSGITCGFSSY